MELEEAKKLIEDAVNRKELCIVIGSCSVEYWGRAASKLLMGKRMLMIKGDGSFGIHQNRKLNAVNYMMNSKIACNFEQGLLSVTAKKLHPKETMNVRFNKIDFVQNFEMEEKEDIRLFGSERELSDQLAQDLSFIEPGLKPVNKEDVFRKGVVDILAEDSAGRMVVIEVKRRQADYNAVQQLHRYMHQVKNLKGKETRGILVAPEIGKKALELLENYGLEFAKIDFEVDNPKSKIKGLQKKQKTIEQFF